jgi:HlyD family secretion protein
MFKKKSNAGAPKLRGAADFLKKHRKKFIIAAVIVAVAVAGGFIITKKKGAVKSDDQTALSTVTRGDVELTITGSAAVEPYERYEIIPLVNGEITSAPYDVGDYVNEGDVLYTFDMSDVELSLQKQQNSMQKSEISRTESQKDLEKLTVTAPCDGVISGMNVSVGDEINNNELVATVSNTQKMKVELPFNSEQIKNISKGQTAVLSSSAHMSSITGTVTHVSNTATAQEDGSMLYTVEVVFDNPGSFTSGVRLGGEINGMVSPGGGEAKYYSEGSVKTETDGTVVKVNH